MADLTKVSHTADAAYRALSDAIPIAEQELADMKAAYAALNAVLKRPMPAPAPLRPGDFREAMRKVDAEG